MRERGGRPGGLLLSAHAEVSVWPMAENINWLEYGCGSTRSLADSRRAGHARFYAKRLDSRTKELLP